jgi:hypothetical protein
MDAGRARYRFGKPGALPGYRMDSVIPSVAAGAFVYNLTRFAARK